MSCWFALSPLEREALELSFRVSAWAVLGSLPVGVATAWLLSRVRFPGKTLLDGVVHLPLVLPPVVTGYLLLLLLGSRGPLGAWLQRVLGIELAFNWKGAAVAAGVMSFPLLVRSVRLSLEEVDRRLEEAASTLGASPVVVFFTVTLPLCLPGILAGMVLAFARCLGEFGATITFVSNIPGQTRTLPLALYSLVQTPGGEERAWRLCLIAVVLSLAALMLSGLLSRLLARWMRG